MSGTDYAVAGVLAVLLVGCVTAGPSDFATYRAYGERPPSFRGLPLASGQIVVGDAGSAFSLLFQLFDEEFHPYVHASVIARENDAFYVYHAVGTIKPPFGRAPTDAIDGGVRREPLYRFLSRQRVAEIYDPPPEIDRARVVEFVRRALRDGVPFDRYFDPNDGAKLYCTELVAAALEAGGSPTIPRRHRRANASLAVLLDWLKIRAADIISPGDLVDPRRRVALISRKYSPRQIALHRAANAELRRRFTADQRLGNLFVWSGTSLEFRPSVVAFRHEALRQGASTAETMDTRALRSAVAALAAREFGAFPKSEPTLDHATFAEARHE